MAHTYTQIYIHVIFAVSGRVNFIRDEIQEELYKYITGIVRNKGQKLIVINGMPDHIHLLIGQKPDIALSDLIRDAKACSSKFMNEKGWFGGKYAWQEGFGAFSYSHSQLDRVAGYIRNQKKHHRRQSFREEYKELLKRFDVNYEEKYLFKEHSDV